MVRAIIAFAVLTWIGPYIWYGLQVVTGRLPEAGVDSVSVPFVLAGLMAAFIIVLFNLIAIKRSR